MPNMQRDHYRGSATADSIWSTEVARQWEGDEWNRWSEIFSQKKSLEGLSLQKDQEAISLVDQQGNQRGDP